MTAPHLLLAVDGGGTNTQALLTDLEGKVVARGLGPSSNLHNVGFEKAFEAIATAIEGALAQVRGTMPAAASASGGARWRSAGIAAACLGLSGVASAAHAALVSKWARDEALAPRFAVVNDSELVLAGGTPDGWGVALISGTGSVCLGRTAEGKSARVGGWGPLLGDEGSGYHIASLALQRATQAADGRADAPALLKAILRHWSLPDPTALIRHVHAETTTMSEIASVATVVVDLAGRNDAAALEVVAVAGRELALHIDTIIRILRLTRPPVALGGRLMLRGALRKTMLAAVKSELGPIAQVTDPPLGAVVLARRLLKEAPRPS
jgi:N-acetylglucosamine kinase-like BadF-type ATPase